MPLLFSLLAWAGADTGFVPPPTPTVTTPLGLFEPPGFTLTPTTV